MSGLTITSTGHTGITVADIDRSIAFYQDILGFEVSEKVYCSGAMFENITGVPGAEMDVVFVRAPGHIIELLCFRKPEDRGRSTLRTCDTGFWHIAFKVRDIERVVAAVREGGFEALSPIQTATEGPPKGLRVVYVRDPDGIVLELIEEPEGIVLEHMFWKK
jgi:catechol 2,3-dioxygenase-like lactoylglutathione lyase family enzyme